MRTTCYFLLAILCLCLPAGCSSSDGNGNGNGDPVEENSPYYQQVAGDWHLTAWNGEPPTEFDAYVTFNADRSFVIYQKIDKPTWETYSGSYRFDDQIISGIYADGTAWGASYTISLDALGNTLRLISQTSTQEVCIYTRATIPSDIKNGAASVKASRAGGFRLF